MGILLLLIHFTVLDVFKIIIHLFTLFVLSLVTHFRGIIVLAFIIHLAGLGVLNKVIQRTCPEQTTQRESDQEPKQDERGICFYP
jgi:hypothetical protein